MPSPARPTLVHTLVGHAATRGEQTAYEYLHDDGRVDSLTYGELLNRATRTAARLRADGGQNGPALLLYPPGLDFVVAVWACLLAGVPAVPAYPPLFGSTDRITARFTRILDDSRATTLLADPLVLGLFTSGLRPEDLPRVLTLEDTTEENSAEKGDGNGGGNGAENGGRTVSGSPDPDVLAELLRTAAVPEDTALIQYTSGSTGQPKGVVLQHRNLLANIKAITEVFQLDETARVVSWLPPYHDMGLIGFILTPVHGAFPVRLMSPVHFLKSPLSWLRQISELGITHTGGPNFAYDLCDRRAATGDLTGLDLSTWRLAFNGAEPIRPATLHRFTERFAAHGFRPEAFLPCYGLAEATLIVTGRHWTAHDSVDEDGRVDCGPVIDGHTLALVDPDTGTPVPDGAEGEIWISGPSISDGYWNSTGTPKANSSASSTEPATCAPATSAGSAPDTSPSPAAARTSSSRTGSTTTPTTSVRPQRRTTPPYVPPQPPSAAPTKRSSSPWRSSARTTTLPPSPPTSGPASSPPPESACTPWSSARPAASPAPPAGRSSTPWPAPATSRANSPAPPSPPHRPPPPPRKRNSSPSSSPPSSPPSARSPPADPTRPSAPWEGTPCAPPRSPRWSRTPSPSPYVSKTYSAPSRPAN